MEPSQRIFICVELTPTVRAELALLRKRFPESESLRWVDPDLMHLTLRFMGNLTEDQVKGVKAATTEAAGRACSPFEMSVEGVGAFPNVRRPSVIWAGVGQGVRELELIYAQLNGRLTAYGFPEPDHAELSSHITVCRVRKGSHADETCLVSQQLRELGVSDLQFGSVPVRALTVMRSYLSRQGPTYTPLALSPLRGALMV